jgi:NADH-quinone oxidoreductase subunit G
MYTLDERSTVRRPHENPDIQRLYSGWLDQPLSHLAHQKLHTHYSSDEAGGGDKP